MNIDIDVQPQFLDLYTKEWTEFAISSGRGAGKSWAVADYCLAMSLQESTLIVCARQYQNSIDDSVYRLLINRISDNGMDDLFEIEKSKIYIKINNSEFVFKGIDRNISSIKSMESIGGNVILWIEEAQDAKDESLRILLPTFKRAKKIKIIYTFNPRYKSDAVYKRFCTGNLPQGSILKHVYSEDNIYFSDENKRERDFAYKNDPEMARHVWDGELCPTSSAMSVIPLNWLRKCIDAHKGLRYGQSYEYIGFDVADTGEDSCAIAHIKGALVSNVLIFDNEHISQSVDFVHNYAINHPIVRIYFDATGVGAGVKSDFNRIRNREYTVEPFMGASKVCGADNIFTGNINNGDYFRNKKAQAWWHIRMRAENTIRLLDGERIDPASCLFLSSSIANLDDLMLELSQAGYKHEDGKLIVDKQPNGEKSPNMADAVVMAFARSIKNGLRAK